MDMETTYQHQFDRKLKMLTKNQQLMLIVDEYINSGQSWPAQSIDIAKWAIANKRYGLAKASLERQCAREISAAMAQVHHVDDQGRRVRTLHPAKISTQQGQLTLWGDIRSANRDHMEAAVKLKRERIIYQCKQAKTDVDSYNDSHPEEPPLQMPLNFTNDVKELESLEQEIDTSASDQEEMHIEPELSVLTQK